MGTPLTRVRILRAEERAMRLTDFRTTEVDIYRALFPYDHLSKPSFEDALRLCGGTAGALQRSIAEHNQGAMPGRAPTRRGRVGPVKYLLLQQQFPKSLPPLQAGFLTLEMFTLQTDSGWWPDDLESDQPYCMKMLDLAMKQWGKPQPFTEWFNSYGKQPDALFNNNWAILNQDRSFAVMNIRLLKQLLFKGNAQRKYRPATVEKMPGFKAFSAYHRSNLQKASVGELFAGYAQLRLMLHPHWFGRCPSARNLVSGLIIMFDRCVLP